MSIIVETTPYEVHKLESNLLAVNSRLEQNKISRLKTFFDDNWYIATRLFGRESNYFGLKLVGDEATGIYIGINIHWNSVALVHCYIFWIPSKHLKEKFEERLISYKNKDGSTKLNMPNIYSKCVANQNKFFSDTVDDGLNKYKENQLIPIDIVSAGEKKRHKRSRKVPPKNLTRQTRKH